MSCYSGKTFGRISVGNEPGFPARKSGTSFGTRKSGHFEHSCYYPPAKRQRIPSTNQVHGEKAKCDQASSFSAWLDAAQEVRDVEARYGQSSSHVQRKTTTEKIQPTEGVNTFST